MCTYTDPKNSRNSIPFWATRGRTRGSQEGNGEEEMGVNLLWFVWGSRAGRWRRARFEHSAGSVAQDCALRSGTCAGK
jgi:hypothetical protein